MSEHDHEPRAHKRDKRNDAAPSAAPASVPGKQTLAQSLEAGSGTKYSGSLFDGRKTPWSNDGDKQEDGSAETLESKLQVLAYRFVWFNDAAQAELEQLRRDISREDSPHWTEHLAASLLGMAVAGGAAGAGLFLAEKLAPAAGDVAREFLQNLFDEGIHVGVEAGTKKLGEGNDSNVVDVFIKAHKDAVRAAQQQNQTAFIMSARKHITSLEQAQMIDTACSGTNMKEAARKQSAASRDAWVTYKAQAHLGVVSSYGPVGKQRSPLDTGPLSTNMATEQQRSKQREGWHQSQHGNDDRLETIPRAAPGPYMPGVLSVFADLPEITDQEMKGTPTVRMAILGVNDAIRSQYEKVPLADMHIPRQINANVRGAPDFGINLDENGHYLQIPEPRRLWLKLRATATRAGSAPYEHDKETQAAKAHANESAVELEHEGLQLLLRELVPTTIDKSVI